MELLKVIFDLCGCSTTRVLEGQGISHTSWWTWISVEAGNNVDRTPERGGIPVVALLAICNSLYIPVKKLFRREGEPVIIPLREELVCQKKRFVSSCFDRRAYQAAFGLRSKVRKPIGAMMKELGYSRRTYDNWMEEDSSLRVAQLLRFCDVFGYDLFSFLVDENTIPVRKPKEEPGVLSEEDEKDHLQRQNAVLQTRNIRLSAQLKDSRKEVENLSKEVTDLKVKNYELEYEVKRLKQHIQLEKNGFTGLVAEAEIPAYGGGNETKLG